MILELKREKYRFNYSDRLSLVVKVEAEERSETEEIVDLEGMLQFV